MLVGYAEFDRMLFLTGYKLLWNI